MSKSEYNYVKAECADGEIISGIVSRYISSENNPYGRYAQIEIERKNHFIVLKQNEISRLEIYDPKTLLPIDTKPSLWDKIVYFMLGKDIKK